MSIDDVDYMSDLFIPSNPKADIKPGLNPKLRKIKEQVKPVSMKCLEKKKREDGLHTPLSVDNKGFAMLARMGFKSGSGLGKSGEGRSEPVSINIKNNREGLGISQIREEMMQLQAKLLRKQVKNADSVDAFRRRFIERAHERSCNADLLKSQRICFTLDSQKGIMEPLKEWFWENYEPVFSTEEEGGLIDEMNVDQPLESRTETKIKEEPNLKVEVKEEPYVEVKVEEPNVEVKVEEPNVEVKVEEPNVEVKGEPKVKIIEEAQVKEEDLDEFSDEELTVQDKLKLLTLYLRRSYFYCIWCGTQFVDEKDLQECPGSTREDH